MRIDKGEDAVLDQTKASLDERHEIKAELLSGGKGHWVQTISGRMNFDLREQESNKLLNINLLFVFLCFPLI